jgi:hypothetical protein
MIRLPIMTISRNCTLCGINVKFDVKAEDYDSWKEGEKLIQEALWYIVPEKREMLLSGICGECWEKEFGGDSEE